VAHAADAREVLSAEAVARVGGVLPRWARETLVAHAADARDVLSSETLARGRTGDRLWDLAQASLVRHGELHNNVRMTWGKAIPGWTADPEMALATLIELNHRFALDGSDPSSYGGLLWCLGLLDRPFRPEQPILGAVRGRSTRRHANRLDLGRYAARVLPSATVRPLEVAVVGAGLSGLTAAQTLHDHGHRVAVFEKARGPGGRMSTRRDAEWRFDHGASYFTVRDRRFARRVASWRRDGLVAPWSGRIAVVERGSVTAKDGGPERLVAVPGMNAVCEHLAADLPVSYGTRVARIEPSAGRWRLVGEEDADLGSYDAVLVSAPAPQTAALLEPVAPEIARQAAGVDLASCWAAMAVFPRAVDVAFDGAFVRDSALAWVSRNSSKPGRPDPEAWVLHASPEWSREHLERGADEVAARLLDAFREAVGHPIAEPDRLVAHRWRHALPPDPRSESCLFDPALRLGACGDWCGGPRVEGAFLSGAAAAGRILALRPSGGQGVLFG